MLDDILPFWQEIGSSTSIIAQKVAEKLKTKTSHTGTLDPLASGVVLILKGEEYFNKEKFIQEDKTYEFNLLFGISTDTHDAMGMVTSYKEYQELDYIEVKNKILDMKGNYHQRYPDFSSKKFQGKHLWEYRRLGLEVPEFYIDGEIKNIEIGQIEKISREVVISLFNQQISQVEGNFRQEEILRQYLPQNLLLPSKFFFIPLSVVMSRGLYVRGFARDISNSLSMPAIVFNLVRIKDGEYNRKSCNLLSEFFKEEITRDSNFLKPRFLELPKK